MIRLFEYGLRERKSTKTMKAFIKGKSLLMVEEKKRYVSESLRYICPTRSARRAVMRVGGIINARSEGNDSQTFCTLIKGFTLNLGVTL